MRLTRRSLLATTPVLAVALTACGSKKDTDSAPASAPQAETSESDNLEEAEGDAADVQPVGPGTYTAKHERGTVYTLTFPVELPDDVKEYFSKVFTKGEALYAAKIDTDNTAATEAAGVSQVDLVDESGETVELQPLYFVLGDTAPTMNDDYTYSTFDGDEISEDEYEALYDASSEVYDKYTIAAVNPRAKATEYFVTDQQLPEKIVWAEAYDSLAPVTFDLGNA